MKALIACEESQRVCIEFRKRGHEAYSCDTEPQSGGHPEWHIRDDVLNVLNDDWDMMIAHPPCTYLSNAGAVHLYPKGKLNKERFSKGEKAKKFFMALYNSQINKICIENPVPSLVFKLPIHSQVIQPFYFGDPFKKKTYLWLKNLPPLIYTCITEKRQSTRATGNWYNKGGKERQKNRSKTFYGIAKAMAEQWG